MLLSLQEEVSCLERELDERDKEDEANGNQRRLKCLERDRMRGKAEERPRHVILAEIKNKLLEYDEVLIKAREMVSFQKPADRDYKSVRTWLHNTKPIVDEEENFIRCKEDMVTLRHGRECAGFDGLVESVLNSLNCRLTRAGLRCSCEEPLIEYSLTFASISSVPETYGTRHRTNIYTTFHQAELIRLWACLLQ